MAKSNSKTIKETHVPPPAKEFKQEQDQRETRLAVAAILMAGMFANPAHGNKWHVSFIDWFISLFGFKNRTAASQADHKQLSGHAIKAADELMYHNETTPIQWKNNID
jgi:hypothetical protein